MPLAATPKLLTTICSSANARSGTHATKETTIRRERVLSQAGMLSSGFVFYGLRRFWSCSLRYAPMQPMIDDDQHRADRSREQDDQQRGSHDELNVLQTDRRH